MLFRIIAIDYKKRTKSERKSRVEQDQRAGITFRGFAKKRISNLNLSFKNAAYTLEDVHVNENTAFLQRCSYAL